MIKLHSSHEVLPRELKYLVLILLGIGVFFRFSHLDYKVYWQDEVVTTLRTSGYTWTELNQDVFKIDPIGVEDLQKYQHINLERGLFDTIRGLAVEEPQHPPLYYAIARLWQQWFGNSIVTLRTLPAVISLFVPLGGYWLCKELFGSPTVGWLAVALMSVSPFDVLYAQENREYSLWAAMILLSSTLLLRAVRAKTKFIWGAYAISTILSCYTFLFSGLVFIGHGIYILLKEKFKLARNTVASYLIVFFSVTVAVLPWLIIAYKYRSSLRVTTNWMSGKVPPLLITKLWELDLSCIFLDLSDEGEIINLGDTSSIIFSLFALSIVVILACLMCYSVYFLCRNTPIKIWLFVLTLIGVTAMFLLLPDLILGGRRSGVSRYLAPCYLGIQISVAYLLANKINSQNSLCKKLWKIVTIILVIGSILSCIVNLQDRVWWTKIDDSNLPAVANILNQEAYPLVLSEVSSDLDVVNVIALSYLIRSKPQFKFINTVDSFEVPTNSSNHIFLLNPSQGLLDKLKRSDQRFE